MRHKLKRFEENKQRPNVIESGKPLFSTIKGKWNAEYFHNTNPIVLEIGAGRGEYTVDLARRFPQKNFIATDIKGDRLWKGSGVALEEGLTNTAFLRMYVEQIEDVIAKQEIDEIWIPFPGPRPKKTQANKRLTGHKFLDIYKRIIKPGGLVRLKTDSDILFAWTLEILKERDDIATLEYTDNLYESDLLEEHFDIQTRFEKKFIKRGKTMKYLKFTFIPDDETPRL